MQGKVKFFRNLPQMVNAKCRMVDDATVRVAESNFRPIYPASVRLPREFIGSIVEEHLDGCVPSVGEWFRRNCSGTRASAPARRGVSADPSARRHRRGVRARRRLVYDELMLMQLGLGISKQLRDGRLTAPVMRIDKLLDERIRKRFPFTLTARPAERGLAKSPTTCNPASR